jgi:hypothetical protein
MPFKKRAARIRVRPHGVVMRSVLTRLKFRFFHNNIALQPETTHWHIRKLRRYD